MPGGLSMTYPFPYKTTDANIDGAAAFDSVTITDTTPSTGFTDNTGALIVRGGVQIQSDLWVNGNIYVAGRVYQANFTPALEATTGTIDQITYTQRAGISQTAIDNSCIFYSFVMNGSYSNASNATLQFSGLGSVSSTVLAVHGNTLFIINDAVLAEVGIQNDPSSIVGKFVYMTNGSPTINGSGTFSITASVALVLSGSAFTPTLTGTGTLGTLTYNTQAGAGGAINDVTAYHMNLNISTTGTNLSVANISGFPQVVDTANSIGSAYSSGTIDGPLMFRFNNGANTATMVNGNAFSSTTINTSSPITLLASGYYLDTGITQTFTPSLSGVGIGAITYSTRTARYQKSALLTVYTITMAGTYTSSNCLAVTITGFANGNGLVDSLTKQIYSNMGSPLYGFMTKNTNVLQLRYTSNNLPLSLTGSGSFDITVTGFFLGFN